MKLHDEFNNNTWSTLSVHIPINSWLHDEFHNDTLRASSVVIRLVMQSLCSSCILKNREYDARKTFDIVVEILKRMYSCSLVWNQPKKSIIN